MDHNTTGVEHQWWGMTGQGPPSTSQPAKQINQTSRFRLDELINEDHVSLNCSNCVFDEADIFSNDITRIKPYFSFPDILLHFLIFQNQIFK
ncbi:hypothetical protein LDENG_00005240 [Lucifuga dentata]|nr:hypothetical protein LDENG_00005240 [Lucifuga dentata]